MAAILIKLPFRLSRQCRFASDLAAPRQNAASGLAELLQNSESSRSAREFSPRSTEGVSARKSARLDSITRKRDRQARTPEITGHPFTREELERQSLRRWQAGDVYSPHDLTGVEMAKLKRTTQAKPGKRDVFDQLGVNPMREYKNFAMMAEFVTDTGRIKPRKLTGLRPVNQRRIARAIRRAIGVGLMPRTYKHPELMRREQNRPRR